MRILFSFIVAAFFLTLSWCLKTCKPSVISLQVFESLQAKVNLVYDLLPAVEMSAMFLRRDVIIKAERSAKTRCVCVQMLE